MRLKFKKHDWRTYYPVQCKRCLWTGNSRFVQGDGDGPFYCPYCGMSDPTDSEFSAFIFQFDSYFGYGFFGFLQEVKELVRYLVCRAFSLITQPVRFLYSKYIWYKTDRYWMELNRDIDKRL